MYFINTFSYFTNDIVALNKMAWPLIPLALCCASLLGDLKGLSEKQLQKTVLNQLFPHTVHVCVH